MNEDSVGWCEWTADRKRIPREFDDTEEKIFYIFSDGKYRKVFDSRVLGTKIGNTRGRLCFIIGWIFGNFRAVSGRLNTAWILASLSFFLFLCGFFFSCAHTICISFADQSIKVCEFKWSRVELARLETDNGSLSIAMILSAESFNLPKNLATMKCNNKKNETRADWIFFHQQTTKRRKNIQILRVWYHLLRISLSTSPFSGIIFRSKWKRREEKNGNKISIWILTTTLTSTPGIFLWKSPFSRLLFLFYFLTSPTRISNGHDGDEVTTRREKQNNSRLLCRSKRYTTLLFFFIIDPSFF